jgi:regulatory protein
LESECIDQALAALNCDWLELAQDLVARRYLRKIKQDPNQVRKAVDFLLRRGFDQKTAYTAVKIHEWPETQQFID